MHPSQFTVSQAPPLSSRPTPGIARSLFHTGVKLVATVPGTGPACSASSPGLKRSQNLQINPTEFQQTAHSGGYISTTAGLMQMPYNLTLSNPFPQRNHSAGLVARLSSVSAVTGQPSHQKQVGAMDGRGIITQVVTPTAEVSLPGGLCVGNAQISAPSCSSRKPPTANGKVFIPLTQASASTKVDAAASSAGQLRSIMPVFRFHTNNRMLESMQVNLLPVLAPCAPSSEGSTVPMLTELKPSSVQDSALHTTCHPTIAGSHSFAHMSQAQILRKVPIATSPPLPKISLPATTSQPVHASHAAMLGAGERAGEPGAKKRRTSAMRKMAASTDDGRPLDLAMLNVKEIPPELMDLLDKVENTITAPETPMALLVPPDYELRKEVKIPKPKPQGKLIRKRKPAPDDIPQTTSAETGCSRTTDSCLGSLPTASASSQSWPMEPSVSTSSFASQTTHCGVQQGPNAGLNSFVLLEHSYSLPCNSHQPTPVEQLPILSESVPLDPEIEFILSRPLTETQEGMVLELSQHIGGVASSSQSNSRPSTGSLDVELAEIARGGIFKGVGEPLDHTATKPCLTVNQEWQADQPQRSVSAPINDHPQMSTCLDSTRLMRGNSVPGHFTFPFVMSMSTVTLLRPGFTEKPTGLSCLSLSTPCSPTSSPRETQPAAIPHAMPTSFPRRRNTVSGDRPVRLHKLARAEQPAHHNARFPNFDVDCVIRGLLNDSRNPAPVPVGSDQAHLMTLQKPQPRYDCLTKHSQNPYVEGLQQQKPVPEKKRLTNVDVVLRRIKKDHAPLAATEPLRESPFLRKDSPTINKIPCHVESLAMKPVVCELPLPLPKTGGIFKLDLSATDIIRQEEEEESFTKLPEYHTDSSQSTRFDGMTFPDLQDSSTMTRDITPRLPHSSQGTSSPASSDDSRKGWGHHKSDSRSRSRPSSASSSSQSSRPYHQHRDTANSGRRQIHIQPLPQGCNKNMLWKHFTQFGSIKDVKIIHVERDDVDPYAFVTFNNSNEASKAVEGGKTSDFRYSTIGFGGRRQFCKTQYEDMDSKHAQSEDAGWNGPGNEEAVDYLEMLKRYKDSK